LVVRGGAARSTGPLSWRREVTPFDWDRKVDADCSISPWAGWSFLADVGHEIPTALLPNLLTATLGAPASALGLIEGL
jgi:hypothetical protein